LRTQISNKNKYIYKYKNKSKNIIAIFVQVIAQVKLWQKRQYYDVKQKSC